MKKIFVLSLMLLGLVMCHEAKANSHFYYAKATVEVAENSKGLGTVYMLNSDDEKVYEDVQRGDDFGDTNGGATVGFMIYNEPVDGYVLVNFTDQYGNTYYYPDDSSGNNPNIITVFATSDVEEDPTVFNLQAHFVLESELPKGELAQATIEAMTKYGTFMSPVDVEIPEDLLAYKVVKTENEYVVLEKINSSTLDAFTPVLLENISLFDTTISATYDPSELPEELPSLTTGLLTGTLEDTMVPMGSYVLEPLVMDETSKFYRVEDDMTFLDPFRCFLTVEGSDLPEYAIGSALTGIQTLLEEGAKAEIYDLEGKKLNNLQKGVNIIGKTKVIVR